MSDTPSRTKEILQAIIDYEPREICKDEFAYDRMVENFRDAARTALEALHPEEIRIGFTKADLREMIGVGFHTMLRKGIDGHGSAELWAYIRELKDGWPEMLDYWIVDPIWQDMTRKPLSPPPTKDPEGDAIRLLREIASSGIEHEDKRISYVTVQIDRETLADIRTFVASCPTEKRGMAWRIPCSKCGKNLKISAVTCGECCAEAKAPGATAEPGEPFTWERVARRVGEEFGPVGPKGYYTFGPAEWQDWMLAQIYAQRDPARTTRAPAFTHWTGAATKPDAPDTEPVSFDDGYVDPPVNCSTLAEIREYALVTPVTPPAPTKKSPSKVCRKCGSTNESHYITGCTTHPVGAFAPYMKVDGTIVVGRVHEDGLLYEATADETLEALLLPPAAAASMAKTPKPGSAYDLPALAKGMRKP